MARRTSPHRALLVAFALATAACSSILGIGDLDAGPAEDGGNDATSEGAVTAEGSPGTEGGVDAGTDQTVADGPSPEGSPDAPTGSDAGDAGVVEGSTFDAPTFDAPPLGDGATTPVVASTGSISAPAGNSQQTHVVFPVHDGRIWYFYVDDDQTKIHANVSADGLTWTSAGSLSLQSLPDFYGSGANFDVKTGDVGGVDVIEIVASLHEMYAMHFRTRIVGGALVTPPSQATDVGGSACEVDGPATVITADGHVLDVTGLDDSRGTYCDMDIYAGPVDDGGTGLSGTFTQVGYYVTAPGETSAHQLLPLASNDVLGAYANGEADVYEFLSWARSTSGAWPDAGSQSVFDSLPEPYNGMGYDDWDICRLSDGEYHAVRHLTGSGTVATPFQHAVFDGVGTWSDAAVPVDKSSPFNDGIALVGDASAADGMLMAVLDTDNATVWVSMWSESASSWGAWSVLPTDDNAKNGLAGSGCGSSHPMLFWAEPVAGSDAGAQEVHGVDVSALF